MTSSKLFLTLLALTLSAAARQIQSLNPAFFNAGIQGCISAGNNADGELLTIHNCNTETLTNQDWQFSSFTEQNAGPQPITIFGDKCIDVVNGINADGTPLQIWTCVPGNTNQQWVSVTDFTFQWNGTDKCVDLTGGSIADGNGLQIWTCGKGNTNQVWVGEPNPDAAQVAYITGGDNSAGGGGPYCIAAASDTDGAEVALVACLNSDFHTTFPNGNITWLLPVAPLTGTISTFSSGGNSKCLDVPNGSTANGVKLQIWSCVSGNTNQQFQNRRGQIEWSGTGKCVDLTDGESVSGNAIQMWDCAVPDDNPNQDWFVDALD